MTEGRVTMFRYQGRSMWPCFQEGDLLEYRPYCMADIQVGDCIVYKTEDERHVTHRVVSKGGTLITRGDAFSAEDKDPVHANQVIGKVTDRHRMGKVSRVTGGTRGQIAGMFYRYAGRIDPQRNARGGKLARRLQAISMVVFKPLWDKGHKKRLKRGDEGDITLWVLGEIIIGRQDDQTLEWAVTWPWNLLVQITDD